MPYHSRMGEMLDSRIGSWLVSIYALLSIAVAAYSFLCSWGQCKALIVAPIMPWAFLLESELGVSISVIAYPLLLLLNASALYAFGVLIEWGLERRRV